MGVWPIARGVRGGFGFGVRGGGLGMLARGQCWYGPYGEGGRGLVAWASPGLSPVPVCVGAFVCVGVLATWSACGLKAMMPRREAGAASGCGCVGGCWCGWGAAMQACRRHVLTVARMCGALCVSHGAACIFCFVLVTHRGNMAGGQQLNMAEGMYA